MRRHTNITLASADEVREIADWLSDPGLWRDTFYLPIAPELAFLRDGIIMVAAAGDLLMVNARLWAVRAAMGDKVDGLLGFSIDYPWSPTKPDIREVDVALPRSTKASPCLPLEIFATMLHNLFSRADVRECRARTRLGGSGGGFPRLFQALGVDLYTTGRAVARDGDASVTSGSGDNEGALCAFYRTDPAAFYSSRAARRYGFSRVR